jgi:anti-sigma factor ChrR (cupin superfamily)
LSGDLHESRRATTSLDAAPPMSTLDPDGFRCVNTDDLAWRPSAFATGVFVKDVATTDGWEMQIVRVEPGARLPMHTHEWPEFVFVLTGELVQHGRRLGPGWASVAGAGSVDEDVHSDTGCVFVLVDRLTPAGT